MHNCRKATATKVKKEKKNELFLIHLGFCLYYLTVFKEILSHFLDDFHVLYYKRELANILSFQGVFQVVVKVSDYKTLTYISSFFVYSLNVCLWTLYVLLNDVQLYNM